MVCSTSHRFEGGTRADLAAGCLYNYGSVFNKSIELIFIQFHDLLGGTI